MRAYEKKKAYRLHCKRQVRKGLVPDASTGLWGQPRDSASSSVAHLRAGHRVGR